MYSINNLIEKKRTNLVNRLIKSGLLFVAHNESIELKKRFEVKGQTYEKPIHLTVRVRFTKTTYEVFVRADAGMYAKDITFDNRLITNIKKLPMFYALSELDSIRA